ncbi:phytoene/squalene synthase family protein [Idiomarina aminovorans]|uniref:phytoene/squalene synthase family protein n=1 Tax=Idiomarina aminovorans TaxID=2914829 RepID=UPI00200432A0|nr:phytoene/squalene synthase family protein [Idiomarina sp. ATCH4]MCK7460181.1 phytoene/squalene synthase family protein [Idiomarina sp. ATCH4]
MKIPINKHEQAEILKKNGKTFYFAGLFLSKTAFQRATALYAFLRSIDDAIDEADSKSTALKRLNSIRSSVPTNVGSNNHLSDDVLIISETSISEFLRGMSYDTGTVEIKDKDELDDYCYCVAGTVGEMMCEALGSKDKRAIDHAIDLGIAMQMTNIARDVYEDAALGRRYLPASWLGELTPTQILAADQNTEPQIRAAICRLIKQARVRYRHARLGIALLPLRSRFAILAASYLYQEIGEQILAEQAVNWRSRKRVGIIRKTIITAKCVVRFLTKPSYWRYIRLGGIGRPSKSSALLNPR